MLVVIHPWEFSFLFLLSICFLQKLKEKEWIKRKHDNLGKKVGHNRGPPEQSYYWGSRWLMDYPLKNCLGAMF